MMQWFAFAAITITAYVGIAVFSQLSGGQATGPWQAFTSAFRPLPFVVIIAANAIFAVGVYYGLVLTRHALPVMLSIGAVTAFAYSLVFLGAEFSFIKLLGIVLVVAGIAVLGF